MNWWQCLRTPELWHNITPTGQPIHRSPVPVEMQQGTNSIPHSHWDAHTNRQTFQSLNGAHLLFRTKSSNLPRLTKLWSRQGRSISICYFINKWCCTRIRGHIADGNHCRLNVGVHRSYDYFLTIDLSIWSTAGRWIQLFSFYNHILFCHWLFAAVVSMSLWMWFCLPLNY